MKKDLISSSDTVIADSFPQPDTMESDPSRLFVENLLVEKGLDRAEVHALLYDPKVVVDNGFIIKSFFGSSPATPSPHVRQRGYDPIYVQKGRIFIEENRDLFESIQERYGISPEIITAILIIETKLGTYEGKYNAFNVYVNLALTNDPAVMSALQIRYGKLHPAIHKDQVSEQMRVRGRWALKELYALIMLSKELRIDPLDVKSSIAGAMGPAQFIPSSFIRFGVAGNTDEIVDPFCMDDAAASIANYLKLAGWTDTDSEKSEQKKRNAIWIYNHHETYVNTVMRLYNELRLSRFNAKVTHQEKQN